MIAPVADRLQAVLDRGAGAIAGLLAAHPLDEIKSHIYAITAPATYAELPDAVTATLRDVDAQGGAAFAGLYRKCLIASIIGDMERRLAQLPLPPEVEAQYPEVIAYLAHDIDEIEDRDYLADPDQVVRELRLASLRSVPCGGFIVDRRSMLPRTIYRYRGLAENLRCLWFVYGRLGGLAPLYRIHIEQRAMTRFSDESQEDVHLRIADLMRLDPPVRGLIGTSWLLDPQLDEVSPHLTELRRLRVDNGAFLRRDGVGEIHTQRALAASRTRRRLYKEGKYQPACYTTFWARSDMLRWADRVRHGRRSKQA